MSTGVLSPYSQPNFLHYVRGEPFLCPVVELGRARAFVRRHFLGVLERAAIGEIGGNSGCPEPCGSRFPRRYRLPRSAGGSSVSPAGSDDQGVGEGGGGQGGRGGGGGIYTQPANNRASVIGPYLIY